MKDILKKFFGIINGVCAFTTLSKRQKLKKKLNLSNYLEFQQKFFHLRIFSLKNAKI